MGSSPNRVTLCEEVMNSLSREASFPERSERITSMDFHHEGEFLVVAGRDDTIVCYHALQGTRLGEIQCGKYGTDLVRYTNSNHSIIHSSHKVNDALRLCCVASNKYLFYYFGHTAPVVSLGMMPENNHAPGVASIFVSGSEDGSVRLWDIRNGQQAGVLNFAGTAPLIAPHPVLPELAIGLNNDTVEIVDVRYLSQPDDHRPRLKHSALTFPSVSETELWSSLKFNATGNRLMICSKAPLIRTCSSDRIKRILAGGVVDPDYGVRIITGYGNACGVPLEASFTPGGEYVISGGCDGMIHGYDVESTREVWNAVESIHEDSVQITSFNPQYLMMAAASGSTLSFWCRESDSEGGSSAEDYSQDSMETEQCNNCSP